MADEQDLAALHAGDADLVHRDFRGADLRKLTIRDRDFSQALVEKAVFTGSDLSGCNFQQAHVANANFSEANLSGAKFSGAVYGVSFELADLRDAQMPTCLFNKCSFDGADLRGANFQNATIREGCSFENALVDETTAFDGVNILRATAREPAFRYYTVERGVLRRIQERDNAPLPDPKSAAQIQLIDKIDALLAELRRLEPTSEEPPPPGIGHNNPPEETPLDRAEHRALTDALNDIKGEANAPTPDKERVKQAESLLVSTGTKILRWIGVRVTMAADEFSKGVGKYLSDPLRVSAAWQIFSSDLSNVTHLVRAFFGL